MYKEIDDYPNYVVYDNGRIQNIKTGRFLQPQFFGNGYLRVGLSHEGKQKQHLIHRLVAQAFLPNPNNLPVVNHKDGNPSNNNVSNLEWCTQEYNTNYDTETTQRGPKPYKPHKEIPPRKPKRKIGQYDTAGNLIAVYNSIIEAAEAIGKAQGQSNICNCANHKPHYNTAYGYVWEYIEQ